MRLLLRWAVDAVAVIVVLYLLPHVLVGSLLTAVVIGVVLGLVNAAARPLFVLLELPLNPATLGISLLVLNIALLELFRLVFGGDFEVTGALWLVIGALVVALLTTVINVLLSKEGE